MNVYTVGYKFYKFDSVRSIAVPAKNKEDAYNKAVWEKIPNVWKGAFPYSAWVEGVTYQNGNYRTFNAHEGKPY